MLLAERASEQDAPPHVVFDALVAERSIWWISVEGEHEPSVTSANVPHTVSFASPFLWRPDDVIEFCIEPHRLGSIVHLRHWSEAPYAALERATLRHRWGEHVDRDLRALRLWWASVSVRDEPVSGRRHRLVDCGPGPRPVVASCRADTGTPPVGRCPTGATVPRPRRAPGRRHHLVRRDGPTPVLGGLPARSPH